MNKKVQQAEPINKLKSITDLTAKSNDELYEYILDDMIQKKFSEQNP